MPAVPWLDGRPWSDRALALEWNLERPSAFGIAVIVCLVIPALQSAVVALLGLALPLRAGADRAGGAGPAATGHLPSWP